MSPLLWCAASVAWMCFACVSLPAPNAEPQEVEALEEIAYQAAGMAIGGLRNGPADAPRVIYVHGSPGEAEAWADFLVRPVAHSESVAIDRPGYGRSKRRAVTSLASQAAALEPLLVERHGHWPILVGHSLGGPIIARAAADHPGRVGGLVIVSGSLDPKLERLRWFNYLAKGLSWVIPGNLRTSNREMWPLKEELRQLSTLLAGITCPVLIVHGTEDGLVPFANVEFMQEAFSSATSVELVALEGVGHFVPWERAPKEALRQGIEELLGSFAR